MTEDDYPVRLQVYMARSGVGSRRTCERYITEGRVQLNGRIVTRLGTKVKIDDIVTYHGRVISPETTFRYIALNKPPGYICANLDPQGRPLAVDLVRKAFPERLFNVGRLDFLSSGLLFLTNDGEFTRIVSHPSSRIEKEYIITTEQPVARDLLDSFKQGVTVDGVRYRIAGYSQLSNRRVRLSLIEGKNREIRNLFRFGKIRVRRLHRMRIGPVLLGDLPSGAYRELSQRQVQSLLREGEGG